MSVSGSPGVTHSYDALGRRIKEDRGGGNYVDMYYSDKWQVIEERKNGSSNAHIQYIWSPVYVDAMILRDRDADGSSGNGLEERLYAIQDANWNITGIMTAAGTVQERYVYDPYGVPTRLTASWTTPGSDAYNWNYLHQGGRYDAASGLYQFRNRELSSALGRWLQTDPIRYQSGDANMYRLVGNSPVNFIDPVGLQQMLFSFGNIDPKHWKKQPPKEPPYSIGDPAPGINTIVCDGRGNVVPQIDAPGGELEKRCGIRDCIEKHEQSHISDVLAYDKDICKRVPQYRTIRISDELQAEAEIKASNVELECLNEKLKKCEPGCKDRLNERIVQITDFRDSFKKRGRG